MIAYRVLDLTDDKGQFCGRLLADLGCEVIKIEKPEGDPARRVGPFYHDIPDPDKSLSWFANNRGKKSVTLDIESDDGRSRLRNLVKDADVVIESFDPGYLDRLGLGYAELSRISPHMVMASITPFGQTGPYRDYQGPDIVVNALAGFMNANGHPDRAPLNTSSPQAFNITGANAAQAILIALYHRERTGEGQYIDVSALESMTGIIIDLHYWTEYHLSFGNREGNVYTQANGIERPFIRPCRDGFVCCFFYAGALGARTNSQLQAWMESEGIVDPALQGVKWEEIDLATTKPEEVARIREIQDAFARFFKTRTRQEIQKEAIGRGMLLAPCCTISDLLASPQLEARGFWTRVKHPELEQTMTYPGPFYKSSVHAPRRAPNIGEHNEEILGLSKAPGPLPAKMAAGEPVGPGGVSQGAFAGLRVLDFTQSLAGPWASRLLADQGATVIHVESATRPDMFRVSPPFKGMTPGINRGLVFADFQAGKLSLSLDMGRPREAGAIARKLVEWADVLVDSRTPGVLEKWGLSYGDLFKIKPDIILARLTNHGTEGPWARQPGYGTQIIGQAGMIGLVGWPDRDPLMFGRSLYADMGSASLFPVTLLAAILHRQKTGEGQSVDASMVEACITYLTTEVLDYAANGREMTTTGNRRPNAAPHGAFPCRDKDSWCAIAARSDDEWGRLCRAMGRPGLAADARFATLADRKKNEDALEEIIAAWTRTLTAREVMTLLQQAGVAAGALNNFQGIVEDPQLVHRQHLRPMSHSEIGTYNVTSFPYILSKTPCVTPRGGPCLGEHNEFVVCQLLGYSDEQFMEMLNAGVFR